MTSTAHHKTPYPLEWPTGWKRTPDNDRTEGKYRYMKARATGNGRQITIHQAQQGLYAELERLGAERLIISSNLVRNLDGTIRSNQRTPDDPGIAIYFKWNGKNMTMAMDDFIEPECNVRRLALAIQAMRDLARNGGGTMMERAFTGFAALPAPITGTEPWYSVLNISPDATVPEIKTRYRSMAKQLHSDTGGEDIRMAALNVARDQALKQGRDQ